MKGVTPQEWRRQVGQHIQARREAKRLSIRAAAKAAGFSEGLWRQLESGRRVVDKDVVRTVSPKAATAAAACAALGWTPDSIDRLLDGNDPIPLDDDPQPPLQVDQDTIDAIVKGAASLWGPALSTLQSMNRRLARIERKLGIPVPKPQAPHDSEVAEQ